MRKYKMTWEEVPTDIRAGLQEIVREYPRRFAGGGQPLSFHQQEAAGFQIHKGDTFEIGYQQPPDAFRALGRLLGEAAEEQDDVAEASRFEMLGVMLDVSRNGVLRPDAFRSLLRRYALMGINMAILYTEDTYEVPDEPFFGYLRGPYTHEELRQLDAYASLFGIEMFPCIQTLAHMLSIFQWPPYAKLADTEQAFIAEEEETYDFLRKLIETASSAFTSNRIHLGMDEAFGLGTGRYKERHGEKPSIDIFCDHLARVRGICEELDLQPMIWSDMFFRLGSKTHDYYDTDVAFSDADRDRLPEDMQLVYWDYYHTDQAYYEQMIERHRELGGEPLMGGGVWTWNRFWCALPFTFTALDACMGACKATGLREVFMTMWADGGCEVDMFSALPGLQVYAEHAYTDQVDMERVRRNFRGSCDATFESWVRAAEIDAIPGWLKPEESYANVGKILLWQDPFLAIMDPQFDELDLQPHYRQLAADLSSAAETEDRLRFPALIAAALELKAHLRRHLAAAYAQEDQRPLRQLLEEVLPELSDRVKHLHACHRDLWMRTYKPFGWEPIDRRYGGLLARLETVADRLRRYLDGEIDEIPELEAELHKLIDNPTTKDMVIHNSRVITPSVIK